MKTLNVRVRVKKFLHAIKFIEAIKAGWAMFVKVFLHIAYNEAYQRTGAVWAQLIKIKGMHNITWSAFRGAVDTERILRDNFLCGAVSLNDAKCNNYVKELLLQRYDADMAKKLSKQIMAGIGFTRSKRRDLRKEQRKSKRKCALAKRAKKVMLQRLDAAYQLAQLIPAMADISRDDFLRVYDEVYSSCDEMLDSARKGDTVLVGVLVRFFSEKNIDQPMTCAINIVKELGTAKAITKSEISEKFQEVGQKPVTKILIIAGLVLIYVVDGLFLYFSYGNLLLLALAFIVALYLAVAILAAIFYRKYSWFNVAVSINVLFLLAIPSFISWLK